MWQMHLLFEIIYKIFSFMNFDIVWIIYNTNKCNETVTLVHHITVLPLTASQTTRRKTWVRHSVLVTIILPLKM